jgi:hypothetical protein
VKNEPRRNTSRIQRYALLLLLAWLAFSPALPQLLGIENPLLRPWQMYRGVALGSAFGAYEFRGLNGELLFVLKVHEALQLERHREQQLYAGSGTVHADFRNGSNFSELAAPFCQREDISTVRFQGQVAHWGRWVSVKLDHQQLCGTQE